MDFWIFILFGFILLIVLLASNSKRKVRPTRIHEVGSTSQLGTSRTQRAPRTRQTRPVTYKRFPRLSQRMQTSRAQHQLVSTLAAAPAGLINVLRHRAIALYQEEYTTSWQEAAHAIVGMERAAGGKAAPLLIETQGADPLVTYLLLQAGFNEDAVTYFRLSTEASTEESAAAVAYIQSLRDQGEAFFLEEEEARKPDTFALHFLLAAGYKILAIKYYRARTGTSLREAKQVIDAHSRVS